MKRGIISCTCALALCANVQAHAQTTTSTLEAKAKALSENLVKLVVPVATAEAIIDTCKRTQPQSSSQIDAARNAWRKVNSLDEFGALMQQFAVRYPSFAKLTTAATPAAAAQAKALLAKYPGACRELSNILATPTFAVGAQVGKLKQQLREMPATVIAPESGNSAAAAPSLPTTLYTLTQISNLLETAMSRAAPAPAKDKTSKEAREKAGNESLNELGTVAVTGRVINKDRMREWRGDQQSTFSMRCHSFIDTVTEQRFAAAKGQEITVAGTLGNLYAHAYAGGSFSMYKCQIVSNLSGMTKASLGERLGLEVRPPEAWEANAGPGKGLATADIAKIVYKGEMNSRFDGLGNMYMDRAERTYVLLKDGTAYHYSWPFPPSDLNVAVAKARDQKAWYRWSESGSALKLTIINGPEAGQTITINSPETLMPLKVGAVFDHYYYFKQVGMGGMRSDRGYTFHRDGTGTFSHSSFVATSLGFGGPSTQVSGPGFAYSGGGGTSLGHLTVNGPSGKRNVRYWIDGYALDITGEDGQIERAFIARFGYDSNDPPQHLYFRGEVLWSEDQKEK